MTVPKSGQHPLNRRLRIEQVISCLTECGGDEAPGPEWIAQLLQPALMISPEVASATFQQTGTERAVVFSQDLTDAAFLLASAQIAIAVPEQQIEKMRCVGIEPLGDGRERACLDTPEGQNLVDEGEVPFVQELEAGLIIGMQVRFVEERRTTSDEIGAVQHCGRRPEALGPS